MTITVLRSQIDAAGLDLPAALVAYRRALEAHSRTVNKPAPSAHPIVEEITRLGGAYEVVDDVTPTPEQVRAALVQLVTAESEARIAAILSPARRRLAEIDLTALNAKTGRTPAEDAERARLNGLLTRIAAVERRAALLAIELEDLPPDALTGWAPVWDA